MHSNSCYPPVLCLKQRHIKASPRFSFLSSILSHPVIALPIRVLSHHVRACARPFLTRSPTHQFSLPLFLSLPFSLLLLARSRLIAHFTYSPGVFRPLCFHPPLSYILYLCAPREKQNKPGEIMSLRTIRNNCLIYILAPMLLLLLLVQWRRGAKDRRETPENTEVPTTADEISGSRPRAAG